MSKTRHQILLEALDELNDMADDKVTKVHEKEAKTLEMLTYMATRARNRITTLTK